ncbi:MULTISPECIES: MotA/TolQ/ExbB proton channel family protein [Alteromonadaceae]|uniref:MotA/TolQ/ExbB proton channel family protein n=1 Tax=Alteromonadaceae TaxID=72275 RepID=UPI001C094F3E|nr:MULTISPECIES: MotA/TolQ/ExbB proton channel family protein [Aliiglaciecola]MBU2876087.1 MotA/TolQ/ExbB proton channel family protein [Aliiglaciecola lipolytica]MDO6713288.1 MotA/TolQ/ExbB proton channel family protein [Aliiglaciecola sp. 2_MG-2023]MDO6754435.1 MotA/TolQ/ExbB proton channel family protein [Aliiglaciecola sp. 1_MG-2023]
MRKLIRNTAVLLVATFAGAAFAQESKPLDLDALLKQLEQGQYQQNQQNTQREKEFVQKRAEQDQMLRDVTSQRNAQLNTSEKLETQFEENEFKLADLNDALDKRLGSLKELFGVLQQVAGDTKNKFYNSTVSAQISGRSEFLDEMAQSMGTSSKLASIEEIERVWFEIQREMTESGKVTKFTTDVVEAGGAKVNKEVVRVGPFALVSDGKYLKYEGETDTVAELIRQPADRYTDSAANLQSSDGELVSFGLDPTGGTILGLLVQAPSLEERIHQGDLVGYIIIAVGAVGILVAFWRFVVLTLVGAKVNAQLKSSKISEGNPLGRVLKVKDAHPNADTESLELHLTEAILAEVPKLGRFLTLVKMISVVAPLGGLLGTVTGMIVTFQQITLFGTGDPKIMAGGISSALITTVLGLVVAIPTTLLYALLSTQSKNIVAILQEQAAGVIAERAETQSGTKA